MDDFTDLLFPQLMYQSPEMTDTRYWRVFAFEFNGLRDQCADL